MYDTETGRATVDLVLHNNSPWSVEILRVTPAKGRGTVGSVRVDGVDIATRGRTVAGGGEATMLIELHCGRIEGDGRLPRQSPPSYSVKLEITVRTPIGLERSRPTDTIDLPTTCFD